MDDPPLPGATQTEPASPRHKSGGNEISFGVAAVVTLMLAIVPAVLWPGAASWTNDEPMLLVHAWSSNHAHRLADRGLSGAFPVPYGPLPTHFYQFLLLFTDNLRAMVVIRAAFCSAVLAGSLLWLGRSLRLTPWFAAVVVLAPFVWWSQRTLWDCSFLVPIASLAVASYASFLRTRSGRSLVIALASVTLVPLIHLQGLPLFAAIAGHAIWRQRAALRQHRAALALALAGIVILNATYFCRVIGAIVVHVTLFKTGHYARASFTEAMSGPLFGGRLLAGEFFLDVMCPLRWNPRAVDAARYVSMLALPLVWMGMAIAAWTQFSHWLTGSAGPHSVRRTLTGISLTCLGLQMLLVGILRAPPWPHYGFAMFPIHVLFAWLAIDMLCRVRLGLPIVAAFGLSLACITFGAAWQLHKFGWDRGRLSPTLDNQIEVAEALDRYSPSAVVWTTVPTYQTYPHELRAIRLIHGTSSATFAVAKSPLLLIRYRDKSITSSNSIELVEIGAGARIPPDATRIDVSPMPPWR